MTKPTRSGITQFRYMHRYMQMTNAYAKETNNQPTHKLVVDKLLQQYERKEISASTFRQKRAAVLAAINSAMDSCTPAEQHQLAELKEMLIEKRSTRLPKKGTRTSSKKKKYVSAEVIDAVLLGLQQANNQHKPPAWADRLNAYVRATMMTGLRPSEWTDATIQIHAATGRKVLTVVNSKNSNGRANGDTRSMFIDQLNGDEKWIELAINYFKLKDCVSAIDAELATTSIIAVLNTSIKRFLERYVVEILVLSGITPQKAAKELEGISPYTFRHIFFSIAKESGASAMEIAALGGHISDQTARIHYARAQAYANGLRVTPTPESIDAVKIRKLETIPSKTPKNEPTFSGAKP